MDVAVSLRGRGLEQYETLFRESDIDAEVLSDRPRKDRRVFRAPQAASPARMRMTQRARSTRGSKSPKSSPRSKRARETRAREKLAVRVGIATGLVVVGDLVGQGSAQDDVRD